MNKTIHFKIEYKKNKNIYEQGYVEIPENIEEMSEYIYYNQSGMEQQSRFINHDEIGLTQIGATDEQLVELDKYNESYYENIDFITEVIETATEDENITILRGDLIIIINEGAKIECEVIESYEDDFMADIKITYNKENIIKLIDDDLLDELAEEIDDIYGGEGHYEWNQGCIHREVSKYHFNEDEYYKEERKEIENEYINIARDKLAKTFSRRLSIFTKYGENAEQLFEECDINDIALVTDDNLHQFLIDEGIIDE